MVWKKGQSGNIHGRPRNYVPRNSYEGLSGDVNENQNQRNQFYSAMIRDEYRFQAEAQDLEDPILFQHKLLSNESLPLAVRATIAASVAPYCHPKLGILAAPRYIETPIEVPDFQTVDQAESFLLTLSQRVGAGELAIDSANDVAAHVRGWIHSVREGQELEIKRLNANASTGPQTIHIEGGLPPLPGTDIIMPELPPDPDVIEATATESIASEVPASPLADPAAPAPGPAA
jgi:hypothetical protein